MRVILGLEKMQSPMQSWRRWQQHFDGLKCRGRSGTSSGLKIPSWFAAVSEMIISVTVLNCQLSSSLVIHSAILAEL